jgi:AraC-like DNA-binding protein
MKHTARPLSNHVVSQARDWNTTEQIISAGIDGVRIEPKDIHNAPNLYFHQAKLGQINFNYLEFGQELFLETRGNLENIFVIQMPLQGHFEMCSAGQCATVSPGMATLPFIDQPMQSHRSENCQLLILSIQRSTLHHQLEQELGYTLSQPIRFQPVMDLRNNNGASWWRTVAFLLAELEADTSYYLSQHGSEYCNQLLLSSLLRIQPHNYSDALLEQENSLAPRHVRRAEEYMRSHCGEKLSVNEVAKATGVSNSALYDGFRKFRGASPLKFLKRIRMEQVHQALIEADHTQTVTEIARQYGIQHLGRFSAEYQRIFGELPSLTIKR